MRDFRPLVCSLLASAVACSGYTPARFAARPPVLDVRDDSPSPVPRGRWVPESVYLSEIYLHRPLREAMDLAPYPDAADVNSMDEIAKSTWFTPRATDVGSMARGPESAGPPLPPFTLLADDALAVASDGFCILDSRGLRYEIVLDPVDRPEMRTAAVAIASRLFWAIGYSTPPVFILRARPEDFWRSEGAPTEVPAKLKASAPPVGGYYRIAAIGWPPGMRLGYAPISGVRSDDSNDLVPHEDRRSLRALKVIAAWLALDGLGPTKTLDRYLGPPGEGHVVHYLVGLDDALGAAGVVRASDPPPAQGGGSPIMRLLTLGLFPNPSPAATQTALPAIGDFPAELDPGSFAPPLPYEPADRMLGPDAYWAAKRILSLSSTHLALAISAGSVTDPRAQRELDRVLEARRRTVAAYWFGQVTPIEVVSLARTKVALRDEAVQHGLAQANVTDYRVSFWTSNGDRLEDAFTVHPQGSVLEFALPERALKAAGDYLVIVVTARRNGRLLPRTFELHLRVAAEGPSVAGVRH